MTALRRPAMLAVALLALFAVLTVTGGATPPPEEHVNETYDAGASERARTVLALDDGYLLAGATNATGSGTDGWLVRADARGNELWARTYGTDGDQGVTSLVAAANGGYLLAGTTTRTDGTTDAWVVKVGPRGREQWTRTYGGSGNEGAEAVVRAVDGAGYLLAGHTNSTGAGKQDAWLVRVGAEGEEQWSRTYGASGVESATSATVADGSYVLAGVTDVETAEGLEAWLFEADADGNVSFTSVFGGDGYDAARAVTRRDGGGYALAAETSSYGGGGVDAWLVTTDGQGRVELNATYGGGGTEQALGVAQTDDGYVLVGLTTFGSGATDALLVGTTTDGQLAWNRIVGGEGRDQAWDIHAVGDGRRVVAGEDSGDGWLLTLGGTWPPETPTATPTATPGPTSTATEPGSTPTDSPTRTSITTARQSETDTTTGTATTPGTGRTRTATATTADGTSPATGAGFGVGMAALGVGGWLIRQRR